MMLDRTVRYQAEQRTHGARPPRVPRPFLAAGLHMLACFWLSQAFFPLMSASPLKVATSILLLASIALLALDILLVKPVKHLDRATQLVFAALTTWCLLTVVRGVTFDSGKLLTLIANPLLGGVVWLLPFAVLNGTRPGTLETLEPVLRLHTLVGTAFAIWAIIDIGVRGSGGHVVAIQNGMLLLYAPPFVLLMGLASRASRQWYFLCLVLGAVAHFLLGNRAPFALSVAFAGLWFSLGVFRDYRKVGAYFLFIVLGGASILFLISELFLRNLGTNWAVDTRSFLIAELKADFSPVDWVIGRGALGTYFSPYFRHIAEMRMIGDSWTRQVNEIGYLHIALKAGLVGVLLYVAMVVRGAKAALSLHNRMGTGILLILSLHLLELTVIGQAAFTPYRLLLWIIVGIAVSAAATGASVRK